MDFIQIIVIVGIIGFYFYRNVRKELAKEQKRDPSRRPDILTQPDGEPADEEEAPETDTPRPAPHDRHATSATTTPGTSRSKSAPGSQAPRTDRAAGGGRHQPAHSRGSPPGIHLLGNLQPEILMQLTILITI